MLVLDKLDRITVLHGVRHKSAHGTVVHNTALLRSLHCGHGTSSNISVSVCTSQLVCDNRLAADDCYVQGVNDAGHSH